MPVRLAMKNQTSSRRRACGTAHRTPSGPPSRRRAPIGVGRCAVPGPSRNTPRAGVRRRRCPARARARCLRGTRARARCAGGRPRRSIGTPRAAERPAAAEREIEAQAERRAWSAAKRSASRNASERNGSVADPARGIVERDGIDRLHFDAADAARLHRLQLALELVVRDRRPEPPPPHHGCRVVRRRGEGVLERGDRVRTASVWSLLIGGGRDPAVPSTEREHARSGGAPRTNH